MQKTSENGRAYEGLEGTAGARQNQRQTSLMSQTRKAAKAKGGIKYNTQIPGIWRLVMLAPFR